MMERQEGLKNQKVMTRSTYEAALVMVAEGCPLWRDLDDYRVVEDEPEPPGETVAAC
jgi:hypothetical protein